MSLNVNFAVLAALVAFAGLSLLSSPQEAFATDFVLDDQASCEAAPFSGTWDNGSSQCTIITNLTINPGDSVTIASGVNPVVAGTIENSGIINISSGGAFGSAGTTNINSGGVINISSGGAFASTSIFGSAGTTNINSGGVINISSGAFLITAKSGTTNINSGGEIINSGTINVNSASTINISNGTINSNTGGIIDIDGVSRILIRNDGEIINSGTIDINSGTILVDTGGTILIHAGGEIIKSAGTILIHAGGEIINSGTIDINSGSSTITGSTSVSAGTITINSGGSININNFGNIYIFDTGTININSGTINVNSGGIFNSSPDRTVNSGGTININSDSSINVNSDSIVGRANFLVNQGNISSGGTINIHSGGLFANIDTIENSGAILIDTGGRIVHAFGTLTNTFGGTIENSGTMTLNQPVTNDGTVNNDCTGTFDPAKITGNSAVDVCEPVANSQSASTDEDASLAIPVAGSNPEVAGNPFAGEQLIFSIQTQPGYGTLALVGGSNTTTSTQLTYTPDANFFGTDSFTFVASDSVPATVSITINAVNDVPVADDQSITNDQDLPVSIVLTGSDVDNDTLMFSVATPPSSGTLSGTAPNLTYTPNESFIGIDSFTFKASDGKADSNMATVAITIDDNMPPTVTGTAARIPDSNGWYNHDVTITWSGSDSGSDIASCDLPTEYSGPDGSSITLTGECIDNKGNVGTGSVMIMYDATAPEITGQAATLPNENGWYSADVEIEFSATDSLSGIDGSATATKTISEESKSQSASHTFTDLAGNSAEGTVDGINLDKTAPILTVPENIEVFPTSPEGAEVEFEAQVSDNLDPSPEIEYSESPSSTFEIGTTTVQVTATDLAGNSATGSFAITVLTPEEATEEVAEMIEDMDLPGGTENSLTSKLDAATNSLEKGNEKPAQNQLGAFINQVEAQAGKSITEGDAAMLIALAEDIVNSIS